MHKNRSKDNLSGFTLIELLVVIAIIGILSAVVLASLNTARLRGNDAAIQANLSTIRTQAEIFHGGAGNNTYGTPQNGCAATAGTLWAEPTIARSVAATDVTNGAGAVVCNSTALGYAVSSALLAGVGGNMFWCVDSTGNSRSHPAALGAGAIVCP